MNNMLIEMALIQDKINMLESNLQAQTSGKLESWEQYTITQLKELNYKLDNERMKLYNLQNKYNYMKNNTEYVPVHKESQTGYSVWLILAMLGFVILCIYIILNNTI